MSGTISGAKIRKELGRQIPAHRLSLSDAFRFVQVQPDSPQDLAFVVGLAARESVPVVPASAFGRPPEIEDWHIRVSLSRMTAISDFSSDSGLVCAQAGVGMQDLSDWLMDKGYTLAVKPDRGLNIELWEFLLHPGSGNYGPRYGCKLAQAFSLTAVLPNGRMFKNSLAPARATGPDFSRVILLGQGRFGLPVEISLRVRPLPRKRVLMSLALTDMVEGIGRSWTVAREAEPEFIEVGLNRRAAQGIPQVFALVELWGEGPGLAVRRELVKKHYGEIATPIDIPYEVLVGFEDTYEFKSEDTTQFHSDRSTIRETLATALADSAHGPARVRVRGFSDDHVCVTTDCDTGRHCRRVHAGAGEIYSSPDGAALLAGVASALDPQGVLAHVPALWGETR
jgi:hypothetical protein